MHNDLPTLNFLLAFEAAGQHASFKKAAEQLCVTPSAISQQIQTLEEQLGVRLFDRGNRRLTLTRAGQAYWHKVRQHLNGLRQASAELRRQHGRQQLRVSVMPPVAHRVVLPRLADFQQRHPGIDLHIETSLNNTDLNAGQADLAIRFGIPPWQDHIHEKLIDVYVQLVCPPGFTARYRLNESFRHVLDMPLVHMTQRPQAWPRWLKQVGLGEPEGQQFSVDDYPAAIQAAETLGAALALFPIENPLLASGRLEAPFPPLGPLDEAVYAVYPEALQGNPAITAFIDWLREQLLTLKGSSPGSN